MSTDRFREWARLHGGLLPTWLAGGWVRAMQGLAAVRPISRMPPDVLSLAGVLALAGAVGAVTWVDDVVDEPEQGSDPGQRLMGIERSLHRGFDGVDPGPDAHPALVAVLDTASRHRLGRELFADFLHSMRMDLTVTGYRDRAALDTYVRGSAQVIGLQVLPVLGTVVDPGRAAPHAAALGTAFQLTNFVRDVAEDLDRGRLYLPADELAAFGVSRELLLECRRGRRTDPRVRTALSDQHYRIREIYRFAGAGVDMLHPVSRPCVATALRLYPEILDRIEQSDFAVFETRAVVGTTRRATVAGAALVRAWWARRSARPPPAGRDRGARARSRPVRRISTLRALSRDDPDPVVRWPGARCSVADNERGGEC